MDSSASISSITLRRTSSDLVEADIDKCIICQEHSDVPTSSTINGRKRIIECANLRNDLVNKRLKLVDKSFFVYHVSNDCYKTYTHKKSIDKIISTNQQNVLKSPEEACTSRDSRSKILPRSAPNIEDDILYRKICVICGHIKHGGVHDKYRISESGRAEKFLKASVYFQDEIFTRTCDLQDIDSIFGADIFYHSKCFSSYILRYQRCTDKDSTTVFKSSKSVVFQQLVSEINPGLEDGKGYTLSDIRDCANKIRPDDVSFSNKELKFLLMNHYGDSIAFSFPQAFNKSVMVFMKSKFIAEEMADNIRASDPMLDCISMLRNSMINVDFNLQDKFCDAQDLKNSLNNIEIPDVWIMFFALLFNFEHDTFENVTCDDDDDDDNRDEDENREMSDKKLSSSRKIKIVALFQMIYFILHNGNMKTPMHVLNGQAIYDTCKSSTLVKSFNHLGICISYEELLRYHCDLATYIAETNVGNVPLPSHFHQNLFTTAAFDNFDHEEATLSGIGGTHDTVSVLFQNKPDIIKKKPNISQSGVTHGPMVFDSELPCQNLKEFIKPARKPTLSEDYIVNDTLFSMDQDDHKCVRRKDIAWIVSRLSLASPENNEVHTYNEDEDQKMPSWSAFNSLISCKDLPVKQVGFIPLIPHPVTEFSTVYTALKNFQNVLGQLTQTSLPISCDEGVYHIAREIQMILPNEFKNLVLVMGSFHMIKVVLACMGRYIRGSGAGMIWMETSIFGQNVVESVLNGTNYVRSLKGMMLLSEAMDRLRWSAFFSNCGTEKYKAQLALLSDLRNAVSAKACDDSKELLQSFCTSSDEMIKDFEQFVSTEKERDETFFFWNQFIEMMSLIHDLIRGDREGDWILHLNTVQALLPIFFVFDRTNYIRWGSVYLEDMRQLPQNHPDVHRNFCDGHFVVKRTPGLFKSIGADMCLEQTINRSQKGSSGIIGSTKNKKYVAKWEMIYHEMLAVSNLHREMSGVTCHYYDLKVNHEFTHAQTTSIEQKIVDIILFVESHENPFTSASGNSKLHNILTQQEMNDGIRNNLLTLRESGCSLYNIFRTERFITRSMKVFDTIKRRNLKTFTSIHSDIKHSGPSSKKKEMLREIAQAQKQVDVARERGLDVKDLFKYDLVAVSYLFDEDDMMTKPVKSNLTKELEKHIAGTDYTLPVNWNEAETACLVDVMANVRKVRVKSLKTFGDFCSSFLSMILNLAGRATQIHFVFDSYIEGSIKDSERKRRSTTGAIKLSNILETTPLPSDMNSFWASNSNKAKLQKFLSCWIIMNSGDKCPNVKIFFSGTIGETTTLCHSVYKEDVLYHSELDSSIEEADVRLMPHAKYATNSGAKRLILLSGDTDVLVISLYYLSTFNHIGLNELWIRAGVGDTTRYIPVHILASKLGEDMCSVLPALHTLSGCDTTSKIGTKCAALKAKPLNFLKEFGVNPYSDSYASKAEEFLVQVIKPGTQLTTLDDLRYWLYHHSKAMSLSQLPPTSHSALDHIKRAYYSTHIIVKCLDENNTLDPKDYGFEEIDSLLLPIVSRRLIPDELIVKCSCSKCSTRRCPCRQQEVPCCKFCACQTIDGNDTDCKNPHMIIRLSIQR